MTKNSVRKLAWKVVQELREVEPDESISLKGISVDIIQAIQDMNKTEEKLMRLVTEAINR